MSLFLCLIAMPAARLAAWQSPATLAVESHGQWITWWRADPAPARWSAADRSVMGAIRWRAGAPGVTWGTLRISGPGEAWRVGVVLVRFDPRVVRLELADGVDSAFGKRWTIDSSPPDAIAAVNAGQFEVGGPWGWVVQDSIERSIPGGGPLAATLVEERPGELRFVPADSLVAVRRQGVRLAFQSFPLVLWHDGEVHPYIREPGHPIDLDHRDARLGLGQLRDGTWLIALTRFEGLEGALDALPFGLTTPEMAALLGALGCREAVLLDGGVSGQVMVKDSAGVVHAWHGLRKVPLGLVLLPAR